MSLRSARSSADLLVLALALAACSRPSPIAAPQPPAQPIAPAQPVASSPPPVAVRTLEIRPAPVAVGETWEITSDVETEIEVRLGNIGVPARPQPPPTAPSQPQQPVAPPIQTMRVSATEHRTIVVEVLATDGVQATSARVDFVGKKRTQKTDTVDIPETVEPIWGRQYTVTRRGETLDVRTSAGKPAPEAEAKAVREALPRFGERERLVAAIPERPLAVGETLEVPGESIQQMMGGAKDNGFEIPLVGLQLRAIEGEGAATQARFAVTAPGRSTQAAVEMRLDLTGELVVRADGRPLAVSIAGPLAMRMKEGAGMQAEGGGRVWMAMKWIERARGGD